jgi:hypothetical protein
MFRWSNLDYDIIPLSLFILVFFIVSSDTYAEISNNTNSATDTAIDNNFVIKFSSRGGYAWQYHSIIYNSTINHLIASDQNYDAIIGDVLSQTMTDSELNDTQKQTLWNIIKEGNILNLSFKNEKPVCCDLVYYNLVIISGNKINTLQWTSLNYDSNSSYKTIHPPAINLVDTLIDYTKNSTEIYSQSEVTVDQK